MKFTLYLIFLSFLTSIAGSSVVTVSQTTISGVACYSSAPGDSIRKAVDSLGDPYDTNACTRLSDIAHIYSQPRTAQQGYDTTRAFMTLCYDAPDGIAFTDMDADNQWRSDDPNRYAEYREWLKSVLYLRTDSVWYCRDVESILGTYAAYWDGILPYPNAGISVMKYIIEHNRCDSTKWIKMLSDAIAGRYKAWQDDSVTAIHDNRDTSIYVYKIEDSIGSHPMDTTIPSIDSIGLSILRGPQYAGVKAGPPTYDPSVDEISGLHVTENPFDNSTAVSFTLNDYGLVTFELYDALGKLETSNGIGQVLYPGEHTFAIDGQKLASGTYYARLSFHNGGTKTVMVRKR